ncbi:MAG: HlyD family secretion protein [Bacteroidetes bacterium]|nr:MAG: HlyD family secretion protein [Bacteroidota bacterium]
MKKLIYIIIISMGLSSCSGNGEKADAYGNFEATETIISAEATGKLLIFNIENGQQLNGAEFIGQVDTVILSLKLKRLVAAKGEIAANTNDILAQINVLKEQKNVMNIEKKRVERLISDSAATGKQYDDIKGKIRVIDYQIESVKVKNSTVLSKLNQANAQIEEVKELIWKCKIYNPVKGTVLQKYAEVYELVMPGKALYKIADMSQMELKVYVDGAQLANIKIGQKAKIYIDKDEDTNTELEGTINWISPSAEFTPKIIQTKEERVKLVYAVKLLVKNDGKLKIGMPG